ncbi:hypothetical protein ACP70R_014926 [Stipagrostis hirtigluma subsp. patula]
MVAESWRGCRSAMAKQASVGGVHTGNGNIDERGKESKRTDVGDLTALAIARKCSVHLEVLDLSFCRELTNEALGMIVDSCPSLRILKLFGCTQITEFFLKGHSNPLVKIVGIEGSVLEEMGNR